MIKYIVFILFSVKVLYGNADIKSTVIVSVVGEVKHSNIIRTDEIFTLKSALDICGGLTPNASKQYINVYRYTEEGNLIVKKLALPRDSNFLLKHRDMVIVRHNVYWSSRKEELDRINKILKKAGKAKGVSP